MKPDFEINKYVERYIDNEMTANELEWFEKEMDGNHHLLHETNLRININNAIREKDVIDLRAKLDDITSAQNSKTSRLRTFYLKGSKYATAAAIVVFVLIGAFLLYNNRSLSSDQLYQKYYEPYEASYNLRSGSVELNNELYKAMSKYQNKEFKEAIALFEKILEQDKSRVGLHLYSGLSHMELEQFQKASNDFSVIIEKDYQLYLDQAEWYLAFCYLMTDNTIKAKEAFNAIASSESYYKKEAGKILRHIN